MIAYCVSGLGADKQVYEKLNLPCEKIVLDWIEPIKNETIEDYSRRLITPISFKENDLIIGVSFGGAIAIEIAKLTNSKSVILISSFDSVKSLPKIGRLIAKTNVFKYLPKSIFVPPSAIVPILFRSKNSKLIKKIILDTDPKFAKWAIQALLKWKQIEEFNALVKIHGEKDFLSKPAKSGNVEIVPNGGHFMIYDLSDKISKIIIKVMKL